MIRRTFWILICLLAPLVGLEGPAFVQPSPCGSFMGNPQIFSVAIKSPESLNLGVPQGYNPGRGRLTRAGIEYVSGTALRLELITDRCTTVQQVRVGSFNLPNDQYSSIGFQASPPSPQPADPERFVHQIWLFLPPVGSGADGTVSITVGRDRGTGSAVASLQIARVLAVETNNTPGIVSISADEIFNLFARSNHELFGPTNSAVLNVNGTNRRIYGYDPSSLGVAITGNGISFAFKFKVDSTCDPTVRATGEFRFNAVNGRLQIDWVNGPSTNFEWPAHCRAIFLVPLFGTIADCIVRYLVSGAPGSIQRRVEANVNDFIAAASGGPVIFSGASTRNGELRIGLNVPAPSVTLQVPYDPFTLSGGTVFGTGEILLPLASGLGMNDAVASGRGTVSSGPNGLPRAGSVDWRAARTVARSGGLLNGDLPVGRLLARPALPNLQSAVAIDQTTFVYAPGCTLRTPAMVVGGQPRFHFGVNDSGDEARRLRNIGARGYQVRVYFVTGSSYANRLPGCRRLDGPGVGGF